MLLLIIDGYVPLIDKNLLCPGRVQLQILSRIFVATLDLITDPVRLDLAQLSFVEISVTVTPVLLHFALNTKTPFGCSRNNA